MQMKDEGKAQGSLALDGGRVKTVYLCGGINKLSDADAKDWREEAKRGLSDWNHLDPMRHDYRGREAELYEQIVHADLEDIGNADVVLVNASRPSWGTAMEVYHAAMLGKQIIAFGAGEKASPWLLYHCDHLLPSLEGALHYLWEMELDLG